MVEKDKSKKDTGKMTNERAPCLYYLYRCTRRVILATALLTMDRAAAEYQAAIEAQKEEEIRNTSIIYP